LLEDTRGTGRMDKVTAFADGLVMPRSDKAAKTAELEQATETADENTEDQ
jgi:hypothetical protein